MNEHGWNDPPQFSYHGSTSKKAISFTKRPTYPADTVPSDSTGRSTLDSSEPPPVVPHLPQTTPINLDSNEMVLLTSDEIIIFLNELTETHRENIQERIYTEIKKRLDNLSKQWREGHISTSVHQRMSQLVKALQDKDYKSAETLHVSLMVDHTAEVQQWMVGVKRLVVIATQYTQ